jgi:hypothetical protein
MESAGMSLSVPYAYASDYSFSPPEETPSLAQSAYGPTGLPTPRDVDQDRTRLCPLHASMVAYAAHQRSAITESLAFENDPNVANVVLYKRDTANPAGPGIPVTVPVRRTDIGDNVGRRGASTIDNTGSPAPHWPATLEAAHAKLHAEQRGGTLAAGYLPDPAWHTSDAMFEITGTQPEVISIDASGASHEARSERVFQAVTTAHRAGRAVVLDVAPELPAADASDHEPLQDGLADGHSYAVVDAWKGQDGRVLLELHNPWGHNRDGELPDSSEPTMTVELRTLVETGGHYLNISGLPQALSYERRSISSIL